MTTRVLFASILLFAANGYQDDGSREQKASPPAARLPPAAPAALAVDMPSLPPEELARVLAQAGDKPLLFHVGFKNLYLQAHIPGSEFLGPGSSPAALDRLRQRVAGLPRTASIVIYCGCCPFYRCPNVRPAYQVLHDLGFSDAKVLLIPHDLGKDWVAKGFPVTRGE